MKDLLLTAALAAVLAAPLAAQTASDGPSGDTIGDTQAADHEETVTDPATVSVHELEPDDLEGARVLDNDGEEIGEVIEAQTDRAAGRPSIVVRVEDREVELFDDQFFVFREDGDGGDADEDGAGEAGDAERAAESASDGERAAAGEDDDAAVSDAAYRVELVIGRETFDALPDREGN
jgi:hypothetical protein